MRIETKQREEIPTTELEAMATNKLWRFYANEVHEYYKACDMYIGNPIGPKHIDLDNWHMYLYKIQRILEYREGTQSKFNRKFKRYVQNPVVDTKTFEANID